ncbi:MAG: hypothetical protein OJJ55_06615 [Rhodococcus sp.]|nr:hypothetical protein [Rhodococcus sp. (in: high G+C Gram-positive bacteria)]
MTLSIWDDGPVPVWLLEHPDGGENSGPYIPDESRCDGLYQVAAVRYGEALSRRERQAAEDYFKLMKACLEAEQHHQRQVKQRTASLIAAPGESKIKSPFTKKEDDAPSED